MTRSQFINRNETLQIWTRHKDGTRIDESDDHGTIYRTVDDVLNRCDEDTTRIVRYDLDTLTGEDVTEEIAAAYIDLHQPCSWEEDTLPIFVKESGAWENECSDEQPAIDLVKEYGTLHTHQGRVVG